MCTFRILVIHFILGAVLAYQPAYAFIASDLTADAHNTESVVLGDIDNDGDPDLIVGNFGQLNRLYLNDGAGNFTSGTNISVDSHDTRSVALGDVDGDGDLDLIVGNYDQANSLYLNDGAGGYDAGSEITADAHSTQSVALGDVNGDGHLDLIVGNYNQANRLYLNNGAGTFGAGSNITADYHGTYSVTLGDVDGDGDLDLIVGNYTQANRLYLNDGNGVFGDGLGGTTGNNITTDAHFTRSVTLGDVDGDGDLDLIAGNNQQVNRLYLNDGSGGFGPGSDITADHDFTWSVALGDADGDGDLDLIAGNGGQPNRLYLNDGTGAFGAGSYITADYHGTWSVTLGDVDGDGDLDLIAGNNGQVNRLYLNNGAGTFGPGSDTTADAQITSSVTLGDVDGDGDLDLIAGNYGNYGNYGEVNRLYLNNGSGNFDTGINISTDTHWTTSVTLGDVDGDDDLDLIAGNDTQANRLYLNNGTGSFGPGSNITADVHNTTSVTLGDVDGDGDLDLVAGNNFFNRLYLNDGAGNFGLGSNITADTDYTTSVTLGDVDGDGDLDLITGNIGVSGAANRLYLNNGAGIFGPGIDITADAHDTRSLTLGDVDEDGDLDLVVGNSPAWDGVQYSGGNNRLYLNDGAGNFGPGSDITTDTHLTLSVSLGDVDRDGDLDLVAGNGISTISDGVNRLYINDGTGNFGPGSDIPADTDYTTSVTLGDVDGDGDLDLVAGNSLAHPNRLYLSHLYRRIYFAETVVATEGATSNDIAISCIGSASTSGSIDYHFEYDTAQADDFSTSLTGGTLTWTVGPCTSKSIPLPIFNDGLLEGDEYFWLIMENPVGIYNSDPLSQVKRYKLTIIDGEVILDSDGDGIIDTLDAFLLDPNESVDTDGDGIGNNADTDDDGDGVADTLDAFPLNPNESVDTDGDGIGNNTDTDDDGDGVPDVFDAFPLDPTKSEASSGGGGGGAFNPLFLALLHITLFGQMRVRRWLSQA